MIYPNIAHSIVLENFHLKNKDLHQISHYPSREHIGNIDDSLMLSSITSMMHQFFIEHRKHWWIFNVTSMFHLCFQCFSTMKPTMFHLLSINDSSMFHRWIINEPMMNNRWRNSYVYVFYDWIQRHKTKESSNFIISNQIEQNHWVKKQKRNNSNFERIKIDWCS